MACCKCTDLALRHAVLLPCPAVLCRLLEAERRALEVEAVDTVLEFNCLLEKLDATKVGGKLFVGTWKSVGINRQAGHRGILQMPARLGGLVMFANASCRRQNSHVLHNHVLACLKPPAPACTACNARPCLHCMVSQVRMDVEVRHLELQALHALALTEAQAHQRRTRAALTTQVGTGRAAVCRACGARGWERCRQGCILC